MQPIKNISKEPLGQSLVFGAQLMKQIRRIAIESVLERIFSDLQRHGRIFFGDSGREIHFELGLGKASPELVSLCGLGPCRAQKIESKFGVVAGRRLDEFMTQLLKQARQVRVALVRV